jgi:hypothetical protein
MAQLRLGASAFDRISWTVRPTLSLTA